MSVTYTMLASIVLLMTALGCQATGTIEEAPRITYITAPEGIRFDHCHFNQAHAHDHCYVRDEVHRCDHELQATTTVVYSQPSTMIIQTRHSTIYGPANEVYFGSLHYPRAAYNYSTFDYWGHPAWGYPAWGYPAWRYPAPNYPARRHGVRQRLKGHTVRQQSSASRAAAGPGVHYKVRDRRPHDDNERRGRLDDSRGRLDDSRGRYDDSRGRYDGSRGGYDKRNWHTQEPRSRQNPDHDELQVERRDQPQQVSRAEPQSQPQRQQPPRNQEHRNQEHHNHRQDSKRHRQGKHRKDP